jgi:hypothetical protein
MEQAGELLLVEALNHTQEIHSSNSFLDIYLRIELPETWQKSARFPAFFNLVPTLCVGTSLPPLRGDWLGLLRDAERPKNRSHAERRNEESRWLILPQALNFLQAFRLLTTLSLYG